MRIGGWSNFKTFQIYVRLAGVIEKGATELLAEAFLPSEHDSMGKVINIYTKPNVSTV